jgi:hypothetical protein
MKFEPKCTRIFHEIHNTISCRHFYAYIHQSEHDSGSQYWGTSNAGTNRGTLKSLKGVLCLNIHIKENKMSRIKIRPQLPSSLFILSNVFWGGSEGYGSMKFEPKCTRIFHEIHNTISCRHFYAYIHQSEHDSGSQYWGTSNAGTNRGTLKSLKGVLCLNIHIKENKMSRIKIRPQLPQLPTRFDPNSQPQLPS